MTHRSDTQSNNNSLWIMLDFCRFLRQVVTFRLVNKSSSTWLLRKNKIIIVINQQKHVEHYMIIWAQMMILKLTDWKYVILDELNCLILTNKLFLGHHYKDTIQIVSNRLNRVESYTFFEPGDKKRTNW